MSLLIETSTPQEAVATRKPEIPDLVSFSPSDRYAPTAAAPQEGQILLVDDDGLLRELISEFLLENGYEVVAVDNGANALRKIMASEFSLILCDMAMPTMSGEMFYRAVERIRPQFCDRFAFMTGDRTHPKNRTFLETHRGFVFEKPFEMQDLLDAIAFTNLRATFSATEN